MQFKAGSQFISVKDACLKEISWEAMALDEADQKGKALKLESGLDGLKTNFQLLLAQEPLRVCKLSSLL